MKIGTLIAAVLLLAATACNRQPDTAPPAEAAPQDHIPPPPGQELPAPDSVGPAPAADTQSARPPAGGTTGGQAPDPSAPSASSPVGPAPAVTGTTPAGSSSPSAAAAQDEGAAVLQRAAAAYANLNSLRADFVMHFNSPLIKMQLTSRGTLYQRRPDRIALHFTDPAGDVILSDGEKYWIYYPSVDAKQVMTCPAEGGEQGVDLQAQFVGDPVRRFRYTLHGQESVAGRPAHVLTLEPRERAGYRSLKVWLDTRDALARRFELTEENSGAVRRFDLTNFQVNASVQDAVFRFTPPADARTVSCL